MSTRTERFADLIREEISRLLLREVRDRRLGFVTLTGATASPDLKTVRVFVSVLGDEEAKTASLQALRAASGFLQRSLFRNLRLRYSPSLAFEIDETMERAERIEAVLRRIHEESAGGSGEDEG